MNTSQHRNGFTLIEAVVTIALMAVLITVTVSQLPKLDHPMDQHTLVERVGSTLESAHVQAVEDRSNVHVATSGGQLIITSSAGTDTESFNAAQLSGALDITPDGTVNGVLSVTADQVPCTFLTLSTSGQARSGTCAAGVVADDPGTTDASTPETDAGNNTGSTTPSPTASDATPIFPAPGAGSVNLPHDGGSLDPRLPIRGGGGANY
ncbi:pilus assembly FimT family protein [Deinococcus ruber]|uniref:Prepilin-type N-terminal cleavage/methylation domain-containing protein n=1 Tax=Deinococcus ruber TaxID=1848197 RepID=A0A918CMF0_9DEIO|nr:prepilin-type N-terminal cleavage/methylation domain-containing protein [Deinococcus ruber]GGR32644.1 hypothetical protein GCM10008957_48880 [Deinococcus ruber]